MTDAPTSEPLLPPESLRTHLADRYTILRVLGSGGMATVWLAEDVRHKRQVAIKVLHPELSAVIGPERFLAEIELTARLQHPHVLPLFDSGAAAGLLYYVMPFVDGETLRDRLERERQLPTDDALRIAREVADALSYAHGLGIVHRDVKPENILLHGGHALVADFGIAIAVTRAGGQRITQTGMSLGTPHYMAPEQAMGEKTVDARADVYALGAVTYEMLAGEPPFSGPSTQAIIAKMMTERPTPLRSVRDTVPVAVDAAIAKALAKLPADRFSSTTAFAAALTAGDAFDAVPSSGARGMARLPPRRTRGLVAGGALLLAAGVAIGIAARGASGDLSSDGAVAPVELDFAGASDGEDGAWITISDDGRLVATHGSDSLGRPTIVVRDLAHARLIAVPGAERGSSPAISPDGRWIAYVGAQGYELRRIPTEGGRSEAIAGATGNQLAWVGEDSIAFRQRNSGGIAVVAARGGAVRVLTRRDSTEFGHFLPSLVPGTRLLLFCALTTPFERTHVDVVDLDSGERTRLLDAACAAQATRTGELLFLRDNALWSVRFDAKRREISGEPRRLVNDVYHEPPTPVRSFSLAENGTLAYQRASAWRAPRRLVMRRRDGRAEPLLGVTGTFMEPRLSPDGRSVLLTMEAANKELWLVDLQRRAMTPIVKSEGAAFGAVWFPDGRRFAYVREVIAYDVWLGSIDGGLRDSALLTSMLDKHVNAVSADGRTLWYEGGASGVFRASLEGGGPTVLDGVSEGRRTALSPDGRWLAIETRGGGTPNVVVVATQGDTRVHRVSLDGGQEPRWTRGGRELVYRNGDAMMSAAIDPATGDAAPPALLFRAPIGPSSEGRTHTYDVSADGERFVMVETAGGTRPLNVVSVGWLQAMRARPEGAAP